MARYSKELLDRIKAITAKRPRTVLEHILKHGHISTEVLKERYGYNHPPRAARDVREHGIALETFKVTAKDGRKIAAYRLASTTLVEHHKLGGRRVFSKNLKDVLIARDGSRCAICHIEYEPRYLQIDHRVPYEVAGDKAAPETRAEAFMLVCGSCNRTKSWSCEQCTNWHEQKSIPTCQSCYWANPERYQHVATREVRRLDLVFCGPDVEHFTRLQKRCAEKNQTLQEIVLDLIRKQ